jgi:glycosyltransferase involved in cell wall biosynthesis
MRPRSVSFVFPMYNEMDNIESAVSKAASVAKELCEDYEIIIVDDASTDGSGRLIDELASKDGHIVPIHLKVNAKFGGALKRGFKAATKEVVVYTDSDFPVKEDDIKKAMGLLDGADIVTAYSLAMKDSSLKRIVISKVYNFLMESFFGLHLRDLNSGFKIYKRDALKDIDIASASPFVDVEIFAEARKRGFKIAQYGLIFELRTKGVSTVSRPAVIARTLFDMFYYKLFREGTRPR